MKKRITYLDILKVFSIFLVCMYHFSITNVTSFEYVSANRNYLVKAASSIATVAVPLFYMINGSLLLNNKLDVKKHYIRTGKFFLQMYFYWILINILYIVFSVFVSSGVDKISFLNVFLLNNYPGLEMHVFLFMKELIAIYIMLPCIKKIYDLMIDKNISTTKILYSLVILFLFVNSYIIVGKLIIFNPALTRLNMTGLLSILPLKDRTITMIIYFFMGGVLHRKYFIDNKPVKLANLLITSILLIVIMNVQWFLLLSSGFSLDIVYNNYFSIFGFLLSHCFFLIFMQLFNKIKLHNNSVLKILANNTDIVYYWHWIIWLFFIRNFVASLNIVGVLENNFILEIIKSIVLVAGISFISHFIKSIYYRVFKGRTRKLNSLL